MHLDVLDLRNFYYRTQLGRVAQRAIRGQVEKLWPPAPGQTGAGVGFAGPLLRPHLSQARRGVGVKRGCRAAPGQTVAGFGFAVPLLRPYLSEARRVIGLMPGPQGVMPWPAGMENVSVLCEETLWPLATGHVDRLVIMHGLETSDNPAAVLDEAHRVLGPGGRALFIVPNRAGLWARRDGTPFGFGRPYTPGQLEAQLKKHGFTPERSMTSLFAPPSEGRFWLRTSAFWESFGHRLPWLAGGVLMVEGAKQGYAPTRGGVGAGRCQARASVRGSIGPARG